LSNAVASIIWTPTCLRTSPVAAIQYYLAVRGTTPGRPFVWADGSSFTAPQVWVFTAIFLPTASAVVPKRQPRQPTFQFLSDPRSWTLGKRCVSQLYSHFTRYCFSCDGGFIRDWRLLLGKVSPMVTFLQPL
jgi:hypothetical protein